MYKKSISPQEVVEFLNSLLELDREAISNLIFTRVSCNMKLAEHPTVQVLQDAVDGRNCVGWLGLLNGLFGINENGYGCILMHCDPIDGKQFITKFSYGEDFSDAVNENLNKN